MMRALWTGASGMIAQQLNVDNIANNLANINTTGYKREGMEFKSLLYETIQEQSTDSEGQPKPVGIQVGLGVRSSAVSSQFTQGPFTETENPWDFAISGDGFFAIQTQDGSRVYSRNGTFQVAAGVEGMTLATSDGQLVLDTNGQPIVFPEDCQVSEIIVDSDGIFYYPDENELAQPMGIQIGLVQFKNAQGLQKLSNSAFKETESSGLATWEVSEGVKSKSKLLQKCVESSNVQAATEMVNLIIAQRAYEMNSKVITASDTMMQQANNLKQ